MAHPMDVKVVGTALNSEGFIGDQWSISGVGLNTFGFLWPCADIWTSSETRITTTWTAVMGASTVEVCVD